MQVRQLFISPGHNYFGHHGKPAGEHPLVEVDSLDCVAGRGIQGDRFFDYKDDYKGQITFFAWEDFVILRRELELSEANPGTTRRNVITEGADLPALIGTEFEVQGIRFLGTEECRPCYWMDTALREGAEEWLKGRGGLRARILTSGILKTDAV